MPVQMIEIEEVQIMQVSDEDLESVLVGGTVDIPYWTVTTSGCLFG
ncbi:hypothetical protein SAMN06295945_0358 [Polynucleobacter meluiroseus]|jgi:hypothetical protein|uniref:Uncharacterized protein n=1 Tax=Polynucleobacter meluiroseus TaxID=1938814 RepID=A0A240DXW2_9BURK|nr:hypothetical protein SAMN06295945_0358 [Polynucleobacter meluiroseus]